MMATLGAIGLFPFLPHWFEKRLDPVAQASVLPWMKMLNEKVQVLSHDMANEAWLALPRWNFIMKQLHPKEHAFYGVLFPSLNADNVKGWSCFICPNRSVNMFDAQHYSFGWYQQVNVIIDSMFTSDVHVQQIAMMIDQVNMGEFPENEMTKTSHALFNHMYFSLTKNDSPANVMCQQLIDSFWQTYSFFWQADEQASTVLLTQNLPDEKSVLAFVDQNWDTSQWVVIKN